MTTLMYPGGPYGTTTTTSLGNTGSDTSVPFTYGSSHYNSSNINPNWPCSSWPSSPPVSSTIDHRVTHHQLLVPLPPPQLKTKNLPVREAYHFNHETTQNHHLLSESCCSSSSSSCCSTTSSSPSSSSPLNELTHLLVQINWHVEMREKAKALSAEALGTEVQVSNNTRGVDVQRIVESQTTTTDSAAQLCGSKCSTTTTTTKRRSRKRKTMSLVEFASAPFSNGNWICTWPGCKYGSRRLEHVSRHARKHTGERRYQCDLCHNRFSRSDNLAKHKEKESCIRKRGRNKYYNPTTTTQNLNLGYL